MDKDTASTDKKTKRDENTELLQLEEERHKKRQNTETVQQKTKTHKRRVT